MTSPVVAVRSVTYSYPSWPWNRRGPALQNVSVEIQQGSMHALVGANGSGKSTLLKLLAGLLKPQGGEVAVFDHAAGSRAVRGRVTWLPESGFGESRLRVIEALELQAAFYAIPKPEQNARSMEVLESVGLTDLAQQPVRKLSKGQKRRVGLASALLPQPSLLLLDEPFDGVDPVWCDTIRTILADFLRDGGTAVISTHRLEDVQGTDATISLFDRGELLHTEKAEDWTATGGCLVRVEGSEVDLERVEQVLRDAGYSPSVERPRRSLSDLLRHWKDRS